MFRWFSGAGGGEAAWPLERILNALKARYESVETVGEDGPITVFGVQDHGVNFVVAVVETAPGSGKVVEVGFLARFVGFPVTVQVVEQLNRNLHIAVATLEGSDLFLMAGLQVSGAYDDGKFAAIIEAWRRDLAVALHGIGDAQTSMIKAFPAARLASARQFATNAAPQETGGAPIDILSNFLGAKAAAKEICDQCDGRGKRGLIARMCEECDGEGFIAARRL